MTNSFPTTTIDTPQHDTKKDKIPGQSARDLRVLSPTIGDNLVPFRPGSRSGLFQQCPANFISVGERCGPTCWRPLGSSHHAALAWATT